MSSSSLIDGSGLHVICYVINLGSHLIGEHAIATNADLSRLLDSRWVFVNQTIQELVQLCPEVDITVEKNSSHR